MNRDAVDSGRKPGLTTEEHKELVELRRRLRVLEMENETLKRASAYFARENVLPKWGFRLVQELAADGVPVAVACRFLGVSTSGYHERRERMPSPRSVADAELTITIRRIHSDSREIYGAPRVLAESCDRASVFRWAASASRGSCDWTDWLASRIAASGAAGSRTRPRTRIS